MKGIKYCKFDDQKKYLALCETNPWLYMWSEPWEKAKTRKHVADFYATSSHKWLQGPKGAGLLYINKKVQSQLKPMWVTFGQNQWQGTVRIFEDYGTRNIAEVLTLGNAVEFQRRLNLHASEKRRQTLREYFQQKCTQYDNILWKSPSSSSMATSIFTIAVKGKNSRDLFRKLYQRNGYVFRAFQNPGWNTLRISPNNFNSFKEMDNFIKLLAVS